MENNSINDKWLIVYQGTLDNYKRDSNKDSYKNKMVLVTGDKTATGERDQTSYLCIDNDTHSVNILIPAIYLRGIGIGKNTYGFSDSILKFASANGINVSFSGGAVTIGIDKDTLDKINSIDNKVAQTVYDAKVTELTNSIDEINNTKAAQSDVEGLSERVGQAEDDIEALQTEQGTQKAAIQQQVQNIANLNTRIDGVNESVAEANKAIEAIEAVLADKADSDTVTQLSSRVDGISNDISNINDEIGKQNADLWTGIKEAEVAAKTYTDGKTATLEGEIGSKYTKPAGGIPEKDLAFKVVTEEGVNNAIRVVATDLNAKIDNKISKTDTIPADNVGGLSNGANGLASTNPIIANRIPYLKADAFAFLQPEDFIVEVKYNDEANWVALENNNADMRGMFAQWNNGTGFHIDGSNTAWQVESKIRITLSPKTPRNAKVDFVALNVNANGRIFDILTEYYDSSSSKEGWYSVGDPVTINTNGIAFVKYGQYFSFAGYARGGARFTFTITTNTQYGSKIVGISGYGNLSAELTPTSSNAPYTLGTLWYWDYLKNVYFPNDIYEGGTPLKNKYASISEIPTTLPNPEPLTYKVNGVTSTYTGSSAANIPQIFTPTAVGRQGQLLQSMGGGAPQWKNLSEIKEAIGFAKDLTGVLEATPEEFTYRPSAGDKSIRDESAVIRRINGNTVVVAQPSGTAEVQNMKVTAIETVGFNQFDKNNAVVGILTSTGSIVNTSSFSKRYFTTRLNVFPNTTYYLLNVANFYHTTSYVFYDAFGNVISSGGLIAPNNSDYNASGTVTTPNNAAYMGVVVHGTFIDQCCINLSHTGVRNGEYEPYKKNTLLLPEIANYFHDGMNGIGEVYDEINSENAITRIGVVDLGTLDWRIVGTANNVDKRIYSYGLSDVAKGVASGVVSNIMCDKYKAVSADQNYLRNKGISLSQTSTGVMLHIYDPDYNSDDKIPDLVASLKGVLLYYELAEPIITPILEPIQLVYDVEDFGTERAISPEDSAPFRADIVYQFNAEGRIRDNGRNIERLEKSTNILNFNIEGLKGRFDDEFVVADGLLSSDDKYYYLPSSRSANQLYNLATEQYVINSIPTEVATATQKLQANVSLAGALNASPNIVYEFPSPLSVLTIETLQSPSGDYDHVWIIRFSRAQIFNITIKPTVRWKDGIVPTFETNTIYELIFKQFNNQIYFGEWKAYRQ